jgi:hypothetical protein
MAEHDVQVTTHRRRIGPVSTACRLALTGVTAWSAVNWTSAGIDWFSRTSTIADPGIWLLIGLGIYYGLYQTAESGFGQRWGIRTVIAFAVALVGAGVVALATEGELWAAPLTWLPYGLVLWFFVSTAIAGPISLAQGTRGCEFGALGELIRRLRGVPHPQRADAMWCIAGLHRIDAWEARRAEARARASSQESRSAGEGR